MKSDQNMSLSKTWRTCELSDLQESSKIYSRSGTMRNGTLYQLAPLVRHIDGKEFGLLPTPCARDYKDTGNPEKLANHAWKGRLVPVLCDRLRKGLPPTPTTFDSGPPLPPRKKNKSGGQKPPLVSEVCSDKYFRLNPQFVEAMMGFPVGWTDLEDNK